MRTRLLFLFLIGIANFSFGQAFQNANWCFGYHARANFNSSPPTSSTSSITLTSSASVSDDNGQLLFYTDGVNVWDKNDLPMLNGSGLYGFTEQQEQNVLIVPKPNSPNLYYVFTLGTIYYYFAGATPTGRGGVHYSVVDMSSGTGQVVPGLKNITINNHNGVPLDYAFDYNATFTNPIFVSEKSRMTSAMYSSGDKIWVAMIIDYFYNYQHTRYFYSFLVTDQGINGIPDGTSPQPAVATAMDGPGYTTMNPYIASMKISPNGQYLCDADDNVELYYFNNLTGNITYNTRVYNMVWTGYSTIGYGVEFSPNSQVVYFTENPYGVSQSGRQVPPSESRANFSVYQCDMEKRSVEKIYDQPPVNSKTESVITPLGGQYPFGIQLGPDNRIYVCAYGPMQQYMYHLGIIYSPNTVGTGCNYVPNGLALAPNTFQNGSLPQWVHKVRPVWPKVYEWGLKLPTSLVKGTSGNIFMTAYSSNLQNNRNHIGAMSSVPNSMFAIHYNNNGITNWVNSSYKYDLFSMRNGRIRMQTQLSYPNYVYYNGTTGVQTPAPLYLPSNEILLAESTTGTYITMDYNTFGTWHTYVHSSAGTTMIDCRPDFHFFNLTTNRFYVSTVREILPNNYRRYFEVYDLVGNNLVLYNSVQQTSGAYPVHVDNQDRVYTIVNGVLYFYNYFTDAISPVNISGLNNSNLRNYYISDPYTSDAIMFYNTSDERVYIPNLVSMQARKISTTNLNSGGGWISSYIIDGDAVYVSGQLYNATTATIGNQSIVPVNSSSSFNSNFITKLSLHIDFSARNSGEFITGREEIKNPATITLFPNPAHTTLRIWIDGKIQDHGSGFTVTITGQAAKPELIRKYYRKGDELDISHLKPGIYFVEVMNDRYQKISRSLLKL